MPKPQKRPRKDFTPARPPVGFVTDSGQWFDVRLVKPTVRCFWIKLLPDSKTIKVRRTSDKLRYEK